MPRLSPSNAARKGKTNPNKDPRQFWNVGGHTKVIVKPGELLDRSLKRFRKKERGASDGFGKLDPSTKRRIRIKSEKAKRKSTGGH